MLKLIECELFRKKRIKFHEGLNVVLGDNQASNSIGKSTLLMIIDFIFGGDSYIEHNDDVVSELGHHEFFYIFEFNKELFYFSRGTLEPKEVYKCNNRFQKIEQITIAEYNKLLKEYYSISWGQTFRSVVSLFSRIWGKYNLEVKRPLHNFPKEKNVDTVKRLLLLFNQYNEILDNEKKLKNLKESDWAIKKAKKFDYIPKITPKKYEKNIIEKDKIELEISKLKEDIVNTTVKLSEALSDEVFQLQSQKKAFLKERDYYKSRLERINRSIKNKVNSSNFELLLAYFPNVNIERLENIDSFHNGITKILSQELLQARKDASKNLEAFNNELNIIDIKIDDLVENSRHNNYLFEKLFELSGKVSNIELENKFFVESNRLQKEIISTETVLSESKQQSLSTVMDRINKKIISINEKIHTEKRRAPELTLFEKDYEYKVFDNTGTGKAYTNLFILDICIFDLTPLPILIHDSVLFKNVENSVVDNIIELYDEQRKQTFISIDELNKYSSTTQEILITHSVIQLSKDKLLFDKDWRA